MLRTIRKRPVTSIFIGLLLFVLSGAVWQWLNMPRMPVAICNETSRCVVWLGSVLDPARYEFYSGTSTKDANVTMLEYIYVTGSLPFRIVNGKFIYKATRARPGWESITELPPNAHRWYMTGRIAKDAKLQEEGDATQ